MSADDTRNAVFVSNDGLVSFDAQGYRLDSLGNRTTSGNSGIWGESKPRYSKPVQEAIDAYNTEVARYEAERDAFLAQLQQQPGMWSTPASAATWRQPAPSPWAGVAQWQQPAAAPAPQSPISNLQSPAYRPPPDQASAQWRQPSMPSTQSIPSTPATDFTNQLDQLRRLSWR